MPKSSTAQKAKTESVSETESLTLVRNLMRMSISTICYLRNLFPEDCFTDRSVSGIQIKSLLPSNNESTLLIDWLEKGVFDSLKQKFLKTMVFGICTDAEDEAGSMVESYEFGISYPSEEGVQLDLAQSSRKKKIEVKAQNKKEITQSMCMMLRTLITLAQTLKQVPETRFLTMKLMYYEEVTPPDYEPMFFKAAKDDEIRRFNENLVQLKIGGVATQYHSMNLKIMATKQLLEEHDGNLGDDENTSGSTHNKDQKEKVGSASEQDKIAGDNQDTTPMACNENIESDEDHTQVSEEADIRETHPKDTTVDEQSPPEIGSKSLSPEDELFVKAITMIQGRSSVSQKELATKLDITSMKAREIFTRLEREGFLEGRGKQSKKVVKGEETRKRLEEYKRGGKTCDEYGEGVASVARSKHSMKKQLSRGRSEVEASDETLPGKMSTVQEAIHQKKRRLYRNPKNTSISSQKEEEEKL